MECDIFCTWVVKGKIPACNTSRQAIATQRDKQCWRKHQVHRECLGGAGKASWEGMSEPGMKSISQEKGCWDAQRKGRKENVSGRGKKGTKTILLEEESLEK